MDTTESCFTKNKSDWDAALKEVDEVSGPGEQDLQDRRKPEKTKPSRILVEVQQGSASRRLAALSWQMRLLRQGSN
jgi:hypothetical protein